MLDFSVSWPQLITVAIANFAASWLWFSPTMPWFKAWAAGIGMDPAKKEMSEADKKGMPLLMGGALLSSFLVSYGFQVFVHSLGAESFAAGAALGLAAWLAFVVTQSLNSRFEGRKTEVILINNGLYMLTYALFGGLLAVWR